MSKKIFCLALVLAIIASFAIVPAFAASSEPMTAYYEISKESGNTAKIILTGDAPDAIENYTIVLTLSGKTGSGLTFGNGLTDVHASALIANGIDASEVYYNTVPGATEIIMQADLNHSTTPFIAAAGNGVALGEVVLANITEAQLSDLVVTIKEKASFGFAGTSVTYTDYTEVGLNAGLTFVDEGLNTPPTYGLILGYTNSYFDTDNAYFAPKADGTGIYPLGVSGQTLFAQLEDLSNADTTYNVTVKCNGAIVVPATNFASGDKIADLTEQGNYEILVAQTYDDGVNTPVEENPANPFLFTVKNPKATTFVPNLQTYAKDDLVKVTTTLEGLVGFTGFDKTDSLTLAINFDKNAFEFDSITPIAGITYDYDASQSGILTQIIANNGASIDGTMPIEVNFKVKGVSGTFEFTCAVVGGVKYASDMDVEANSNMPWIFAMDTVTPFDPTDAAADPLGLWFAPINYLPEFTPFTVKVSSPLAISVSTHVKNAQAGVGEPLPALADLNTTFVQGTLHNTVTLVAPEGKAGVQYIMCEVERNGTVVYDSYMDYDASYRGCAYTANITGDYVVKIYREDEGIASAVEVKFSIKNDSGSNYSQILYGDINDNGVPNSTDQLIISRLANGVFDVANGDFTWTTKNAVGNDAGYKPSTYYYGDLDSNLSYSSVDVTLLTLMMGGKVKVDDLPVYKAPQ